MTRFVVGRWARTRRRDRLPGTRRSNDVPPEALTVMARRSGDGYITCAQGHRHWGRYGAAGALLRHVDPQGQERYLLTHRSPEVHEGGTWGIPGGAMDLGEAPHEAAFRETEEELGVRPQAQNVR